MNRFCLSFILSAILIPVFSQPNFSVTDPEKKFKEAKEFFVKEQYSLAYPLFRELQHDLKERIGTSRNYVVQDLEYYSIVSSLKLDQQVAEDNAKSFVDVANNEPRQQMMSYHLAKYYFTKKISIMPSPIMNVRVIITSATKKLLMQNLRRLIVISTSNNLNRPSPSSMRSISFLRTNIIFRPIIITGTSVTRTGSLMKL